MFILEQGNKITVKMSQSHCKKGNKFCLIDYFAETKINITEARAMVGGMGALSGNSDNKI